MYERKHHPLLSRRLFAWRLVRHAAAAVAFVGASLLAGMAGYMHYEHLGTLDAFVNAAMLLGGMGPLEAPATEGGKLFAGVYALYAGLVFLVGIAIVLAPLVHRVLHTFHWEAKE